MSLLNYQKRIKRDAKQIKRAYAVTYAIHIMTAIFLLGVASYILYATFNYFTRG